MSDKPKKVYFKLWFAKANKNQSEINYYFVPDGVLIEGYDSNGLFQSNVDKYSVDYSGILKYDVERLIKPLTENNSSNMIVEAISYIAWLRQSLYKKKYHRINQGMKFVIGYLKHVLAVI